MFCFYRIVSFFLLAKNFGKVFNMYFIDILPGHFVFFTACLYCLGVYGLACNIENFLAVLVGTELVILALSLNIIYFSVIHYDLIGQIFAILLLLFTAKVSRKV